MTYDQEILAVLPYVGGFATGLVAEKVKPQFGHNARTRRSFGLAC